MRQAGIQWLGITWTLLYAALIVWLYVAAPRTLREASNEASAAIGAYQIDQARFDAARELFSHGQYAAARDEWQRADPARRDARTQFYVAYACYREGWGRVYSDETLYRAGLEAVNRAIELSPQGPLTVEDPELRMHTAAELKAELEAGLARKWSDLNPVELLRRERK
jgi:tetratricopeptide (TPR) repeat protein